MEDLGARWKAGHGGGVGVLSLCMGLTPLGVCIFEGEEAGNAGESWEGGAESVGLLPYLRDQLGLLFRALTKVRM